METISITSQKEPFSCARCGETIQSYESFQAIGQHVECPKSKKLFQLHFQFIAGPRKGETDLISQANEDFELYGGSEITWIADVKSRYVLPEDASWMLCNEESKHFVRMAESVVV